MSSARPSSASLFGQALAELTQTSQIVDHVPPITEGSTEMVRGQRAIDIRWQEDSKTYVTVAVDASGHNVAWRGATPNRMPTFLAEVFTDLPVPAITPPAHPVLCTPTAT